MMKNAQTKTWIEDCEKRTSIQKEKLSNLQESFKKAEKPSKNINDAIQRLNLLLKLYNSDPMNCAFPTEEIMKELLEGQDYQVKELEDDRVSFVIGDFELELVPRKNSVVEKFDGNEKPLLMVRNIHWTEEAAKLKDRKTVYDRTPEYDVIFDSIFMNIWPHQVPVKLAQISLNQRALPQILLIPETIRIFFALMFNRKAKKIKDAWAVECQKRDEIFIQQLRGYQKNLAVKFEKIRNNGLFDRLKLIEKESDFLVGFYFHTHKWSYMDCPEVEQFIDKANRGQF